MRVSGLLVLLAALIGAGPVNAACWQWSKTAGNNATADPSINWAEGQSPSSVNDSARAMMARLAECRDDTSGALLTTGTATAYAVTTNQGLNAVPTDGQQLVVRLNLTNGVAATLAADGGTAYAIQSAPGSAIGAGTLIAGTPYRMTFNLASTAWVLQDFYFAAIPANSITTSMLQNAAVTYAKMQNVTAARLLGNPTGGAAAPSEIALGTNLSFSGSTLNASVPAASFAGYLSGLILSTAGGTGTFGIAAGAANDTASAGIMVLASAFTKTTASWALGTGNGALDSGAIAINTWYHVFIIAIPNTAPDICFSASATGCAAGVGVIPGTYTLKRRIGSMKTDGSSQWTLFTQTNDKFIWSVSVQDANSVTTTNARVSKTLTVPTGVVVNALFRANVVGASSQGVLFTSLQESDQAPAISGGLCDINHIAGSVEAVSLERLVNTSAQIGVRSSVNGSGSYNIFTYGWDDARGKN